MIEFKRHIKYSAYTLTCKDKFDDEFGWMGKYPIDCNIFYEVREGKKFIGAFYGTDFSFDDRWFEVPTFQILYLFVNPKYRKKGYGGKILEFVKTLPFDRIEIHSTRERISFYRKFGFKRYKYQSNDEECVWMYYERKSKKL